MSKSRPITADEAQRLTQQKQLNDLEDIHDTKKQQLKETVEIKREDIVSPTPSTSSVESQPAKKSSSFLDKLKSPFQKSSSLVSLTTEHEEAKNKIIDKHKKDAVKLAEVEKQQKILTQKTTLSELETLKMKQLAEMNTLKEELKAKEVQLANAQDAYTDLNKKYVTQHTLLEFYKNPDKKSERGDQLRQWFTSADTVHKLTEKHAQENQAYSAEIKALKARLLELNAQDQAMQKQVQQQSEQVNVYRDQIRILEVEAATKQEKFKKVVESENKNKGDQKTIKDLTRERDTLKKTFEVDKQELLSQSRMLEAQNKGLKLSLQTATDKNLPLLQERDRFKKELDALAKENKTLNDYVGKVAIEKNTLLHKRDTLIGENKKLTEALRVRESQLQHNRKTITSMHKDHESLLSAGQAFSIDYAPWSNKKLAIFSSLSLVPIITGIVFLTTNPAFSYFMGAFVVGGSAISSLGLCLVVAGALALLYMGYKVASRYFKKDAIEKINSYKKYPESDLPQMDISSSSTIANELNIKPIISPKTPRKAATLRQIEPPPMLPGPSLGIATTVYAKKLSTNPFVTTPVQKLSPV